MHCQNSKQYHVLPDQHYGTILCFCILYGRISVTEYIGVNPGQRWFSFKAAIPANAGIKAVKDKLAIAVEYLQVKLLQVCCPGHQENIIPLIAVGCECIRNVDIAGPLFHADIFNRSTAVIGYRYTVCSRPGCPVKGLGTAVLPEILPTGLCKRQIYPG